MSEKTSQQLKELFNDKEYVKHLLSLENNEKVFAELKTKSIDLDMEDITKVVEILKKKQNGELTDKELELVSGGYIVVY